MGKVATRREISKETSRKTVSSKLYWFSIAMLIFAGLLGLTGIGLVLAIPLAIVSLFLVRYSKRRAKYKVSENLETRWK